MSRIHENLKLAIDIVSNHPECQFDLGYYERQDSCGTIYCTAGLLATQEYFVSQLVEFSLLDSLANALSTATDLFGHDCYHRFFCSRGKGDWDDLIIRTEHEAGNLLTDKQLAVERLRRGLFLTA